MPQIFLNGKNTIVMHNTCEDSLLAAPIILDLVLLSELITRIELKKDGEEYHGAAWIWTGSIWTDSSCCIMTDPC